jgi:alpha-galactosidase
MVLTSGYPRINGAAVFGCRPAAPFLFQIAATGSAPLRYEVDALPRGLKVNAKTGLITGQLNLPGRYPVVVKVSGAGGCATRTLTIHCGARLALTPPMGWSSWNCWAESVTAVHVVASARAMAETLRAHGWSYVNIDDGWQGERTKTGREHALQPSERFPSMSGLADEVHALGLKLGIYSSPWATTYAGFCGGSSDDPKGKFITPIVETAWWQRRAQFHQARHSFAAADARQWAAWGVDYLKYDWFPNDLAATREMTTALRDCGRDVVYSLSNNLPLSSVADTLPHAHLWRTTGDIRDVWSNHTVTTEGHQGIKDIIRHHDAFQRFQVPGAWNDPDMLVLGRVGWGPELRATRLTAEEQRTHFAMWCLWSAPLLVGCPLDQLDLFTLGLLTHDELIDLNQDALGVQAYATEATAQSEQRIYIKPLADGDVALGFLNLGERRVTIGTSFAAISLTGRQHVRDVWARKDVGLETKEFAATVPPHGCAVYRLRPEHRLTN